MDERKNELLAVVDNLFDEHKAWTESNVDYLTEEVEAAIDDTIAMFASGDIPQACRQLDHAVAALSNEWDAYRSAVRIDPAQPDVPPQSFWKAFEAVRNCHRAAAKPMPLRLESVKELTDQKVSDQQICKMYGFIDEFDRPELWRLSEERAEPGKHTGPGTGWVPPLERQRLEQEQRQQQIIAGIQSRSAAKVQRASAPAPEPWEDLFTQGLSAKQIAKMKRCTIQDVVDKAEELGFEPPSMDYTDVRTSRAPQEPEINEHAARSIDSYSAKGKGSEAAPKKRPKHRQTKAAKGKAKAPKPAPVAEADDDDEPLDEPTVEEKILAMHGDGWELPTIAAGVELPIAEVEKIIAAHEPAVV
jgi:hypothetical protein